MIGRTISRYRIVSQLGAGGMGVVYAAVDLRLGRSVALKFLPEDLAKDAGAVDRLRFEARAASALNHGNICTIYDIDEYEGQPFIAMELLKGQTLRERLSGGPLKVHQLVDIGIQIADALAAAHRENIVHRDIKPANIFLTERNQVKILDFGLAKLTTDLVSSGTTRMTRDQVTAEGVTLGTISYMSPEQATGEELDGRTDLFSLGVVLYECATGRLPFPGKTSAVILEAILNRAPVAPIVLNPEIPVRLQEVINNSLEKDPQLRYQSGADLCADLRRVRRDLESGHSQTVRTVERSQPGHSSGEGQPVTGSRPGKYRALTGTAVALLALAAAVFYVRGSREPAPAPAASAVAARSEADLQSRLDLANGSLEAKNYRGALAYAGQVLAIAPDHAGAAKIRDEARTMLARFDAAIADARRQADAGDIRAATQALEAARAIDPTSPSVIEIAARLADQVRTRNDAVRQRDVTARPAAPLPTTPTPSATSTKTPAPLPIPSGNQSPPAPVQPPPSQTSVATVQPVAPDVPAPAARPTPPPQEAAPAERIAREPARGAAPAGEDEDAALRRVVANYARAIETKDLALFRTVKPNLSREEERRLADGFRAVAAQRVELNVLSIDRRGQDASVRVRRRDTIQAAGRPQVTDTQQTITLARTDAGWVIVEIR